MNNLIGNKDLRVVGLSIEQERLILRRYLIYSLSVIVFYALLTGRNFLLYSKKDDLYFLIGSLTIVTICASYFLIQNHPVAKNYITIIFSLTLVLSFFTYGGINGFFTIDFINLIIFTFLLYNSKSLYRYGIFFILLFGGLVVVQLYDLLPMQESPEYFNEKTDAIIFVISRLILTVNMIFYLKLRHNVERFKLIKKNEDFEELNDQLKSSNEELIYQNDEVNRQKKLIDEQNIKLKKAQEDLLNTNNSLEVRILERTEELLNVNNKLKKTLTELDRFVYSASHDLSAPLKSILGIVHIAKRESKNTQFVEHFNYIEKSINKQEKVIQDLIQYSRNNQNNVVHSTLDLELLIDTVLSELQFYPGFEKVKIIKKLSFLHLNTDESRMHMILNNLLSNAIKYRDQERNNAEIVVSSRAEKDHWTLDIEDNGQGIDEHEKGKIFQMFYRANEQSDGSGLGLFIVAEAVEKLNGTVEVKSQPKEGSRFTLKFPYIDLDH